METINLKIDNYKLNKKQKKDLQNKIESFSKQLPYQSIFSINLYYKNKFYGTLKVDFHGNSFFAKASSDLINPLLRSLCNKLQKQISKWKTSRTLEEITGIINLPQKKKKLIKQYNQAS